MSNPLYLPNLTNTPPGGDWRYKVPETGQLFRSATRGGLMTELKAHYAANGYPEPSDLWQKVEQYICADVPEYCGGAPRQEEQKPITEAGLRHTFHAVVQGTRTLISWVAGGSERVSVDQAGARASVCNGCEENQEPLGCTTCNMGVFKEMARKVVGNRTFAGQQSLKSCRICACQLQAKVMIPIKHIWPHMPEHQKKRLPAHCWVKKEAEKL